MLCVLRQPPSPQLNSNSTYITASDNYSAVPWTRLRYLSWKESQVRDVLTLRLYEHGLKCWVSPQSIQGFFQMTSDVQLTWRVGNRWTVVPWSGRGPNQLVFRVPRRHVIWSVVVPWRALSVLWLPTVSKQIPLPPNRTFYFYFFAKLKMEGSWLLPSRSMFGLHRGSRY
jgi:hypothetical protein